MRTVLRMMAALLLLTVAALPGFSQSRKYKAGALYELSGPVKEVVVHTENQFAFPSTLKFTKEGRLVLRPFMYDKNGYPIGAGHRFDKDFSRIFIDYNSDLQPSSILMITNTDEKDKDNPCLWDFSFIYDGKRLGSLTAKGGRKGVSPMEIVMEYSNEKYDDFGNWISRDVKSTTRQEGQQPVENRYTETREIKYYEQ